MRVLLVTGKGGVGKTTTAAATALRLAADGRSVVVTSADPAHSLGDSFDVQLGPVPVEVAPGCSAQQIDARERFEEHWAEIRDWLLQVFDWAGVESVEAARLSREHNDANVICIGERLTGEEVAKDALDAWIAAEFQGGRHAERVAKISALDSGLPG